MDNSIPDSSPLCHLTTTSLFFAYVGCNLSGLAATITHATSLASYKSTRGLDERLEVLDHRHKWRKDAWTWNKSPNDLGIPVVGQNKRGCGRFRQFRPTHRAAPLRWKLKAAQGCFDMPSLESNTSADSVMLGRLRYRMHAVG